MTNEQCAQSAATTATCARKPTFGASVSTALKACGHTVWYIAAGTYAMRTGKMTFAPQGAPDRMVLLKGGRVVWIYTQPIQSTKHEEAREQQIRQLESLGHVVLFPTSVIDAVLSVQSAEAAYGGVAEHAELPTA